jgi:hypothetical protein
MRTAARIAALTLNTLLLVYGLWSLYLVRRILFLERPYRGEWIFLIPLLLVIVTPISTFVAILGSPGPRRS